MSELTQKELKEILRYNPDTGEFKYIKNRRGRTRKNLIAGYINTVTGYRSISIKGVSYPSARIACLYMNGYFPEHDMDHINRTRDDDRWFNLREATRSCNMRNRGIDKRNKSGVTGVSWDIHNCLWQAYIGTGEGVRHLGCYEFFNDAVMVRWDAEKLYKYPNCISNSSAYLYLKKKDLIY